MQKFLEVALEGALAAGREIMTVYEREDFQTELKEDSSPLTVADKKANEVINRVLNSTSIPLISEENRIIDFEERKTWEKCWIVDPLDGTKEFIKRNDEFTVNIALISGGKPQLGVIFAPALEVLYFAIVSEGKAFKVKGVSADKDLERLLLDAKEIKPFKSDSSLKVVGSRSHMNEETKKLMQKLRENYSEVELIPKGSSLKFCLVAEGEAQIYPRLGPTMEWDTAAGQAICEAVGLKCIFTETGKVVTYNREQLLNGSFIVSHGG